jgi:hypothetical protein
MLPKVSEKELYAQKPSKKNKFPTEKRTNKITQYMISFLIVPGKLAFDNSQIKKESERIIRILKGSAFSYFFTILWRYQPIVSVHSIKKRSGINNCHIPVFLFNRSMAAMNVHHSAITVILK